MLDFTGWLSWTGFAVCAAAAAVMAVGLYYSGESRKEAQKGEATRNTPVEEVPDRGASSGYTNTQMDRFTLEDSVTEAKEKKEKDETLGVKVNGQFGMLYPSNMLMKLSEFFFFEKSDRKCKGLEKKPQTHTVLKKKYDQMKELIKQKEELIKLMFQGFEQKQQAHLILKGKYDKLKDLVRRKEELLKGHESSLINLEDRRKLLEQLLTEVLRESELVSKKLERMEEDYDDLWSRYNQTSSSLAEAEMRAKSALESNIQLKDENSILRDQVQTLQASLDKQLHQTHTIKRGCVVAANGSAELENEVPQEHEEDELAA
ncbi:hypothetical protein Baya_15397 [Bagarius yarrelli]|uniref:Uncharacterized protein n=1 Tax=Bagarius yarrelli TaxID=175774 RepID=A0A556VBR5_BAGYA|nr:hypothetical protein Baya_15397 [Bagarius yarrelli]